MRAFWNVQNHLHQITQAASGPLVVVAVYKLNSCVALIGIANLEAAQEVRKMDLLSYELDPVSSTHAFPLMHLLKGAGLKNTIVTTYSKIKDHFCRPCQ